MIKAIANYCSGIPPVFIDGVLYCLIASFTFLQGYMSGDEAVKWISPEIRFWMNATIGTLAAAAAALKMFRSTTYSDHQEQKKATEQTEFIRKSQEPGPVP